MSKITKLPIPENMTRVETGVVKFGDDWNGVFIRGDNAVNYAFLLDLLINNHDFKNDFISEAQIKGLQQLLSSCRQ